MGRIPVSLIVALVLWAGSSAQELPVLYLKVSVLDQNLRAVPVARHALLISDNPVTTSPRRVVTSPEGTAQIRLRPGSYTVESDRPFVRDGRTYEWVQTLTVGMGRDTTLELTASNAVVGVPEAGLAGEVSPVPETLASRDTAMLTTWQASAFALWTPLAYMGGVLVDESGLVATSRRAMGDAASVEVQVSSAVKVTGVVVLGDPAHEVGIVRVHPSVVSGIRPVPLACRATDLPTSDVDLRAIDVPMFGDKDLESPAGASPGSAAFDEQGRFAGVLSAAEDDGSSRRDLDVLGPVSVCDAVAAARARLASTPEPDATRLPVESSHRPKTAAVETAGPRPALNLASYQLSSSDFDITFLTPRVMAAAEGRQGWTGGGGDGLNGLRVATEFEQWSRYVAEAPPALFVRVTPRLVEGFWMKVARGAASTQGAQIPPIKRLRPGFSRMRILCGGKDVAPIHPFRIQARVTETDAVEEGFYVFDPAAIGPACGTVTIVVSSVKEPARSETRAVDPAIIRRVWDDFADVRAALLP